MCIQCLVMYIQNLLMPVQYLMFNIQFLVINVKYLPLFGQKPIMYVQYVIELCLHFWKDSRSFEDNMSRCQLPAIRLINQFEIYVRVNNNVIYFLFL